MNEKDKKMDGKIENTMYLLELIEEVQCQINSFKNMKTKKTKVKIYKRNCTRKPFPNRSIQITKACQLLTIRSEERMMNIL